MSSGSRSNSITTEEGDAMYVNVILPPGFGFNPTDQLLVSYYLKNKIQGTDSHFRHLIPEIDVCKYEPCDLPAFLPDVHEKDWFFFSRPKYKDINNPRRDRATDQGFYKSTGEEREIRAEESKALIGKKRFLTFHEGRGPKAKKSDWVIHEYYYLTETEAGSKPTKQMDFVLYRLRNKSASYKKPKGDPTRGELADSGANLEYDQAVLLDVIAEPAEHLGNKKLGDVSSSESPDGSFLIDWNDFWNFDDETAGLKFSDFDYPASSDRGEIPNSPSQLAQPQQPLQTPQPHQLRHPHQPLQPHQPQDCTERQSLVPDNISYREYKNNSPTNDLNEQVSKPNGVQDRATDEMIPEECFHPDEFMGPPFDLIRLQDYLPPSPMNMELGDGVHPNNSIGCIDELLSQEDMEISTLFP